MDIYSKEAILDQFRADLAKIPGVSSTRISAYVFAGKQFIEFLQDRYGEKWLEFANDQFVAKLFLNSINVSDRTREEKAEALSRFQNFLGERGKLAWWAAWVQRIQRHPLIFLGGLLFATIFTIWQIADLAGFNPVRIMAWGVPTPTFTLSTTSTIAPNQVTLEPTQQYFTPKNVPASIPTSKPPIQETVTPSLSPIVTLTDLTLTQLPDTPSITASANNLPFIFNYSSKDAARKAGFTVLHPAWTSITNGNFINDLSIQGDFVWAATTGGAIRWDIRTGDYIKLTSEYGLGGNQVQAVAVASDGSVWFGIWGSGASRLGTDGSWKYYTEEDGLANNYIFDITITSDGAIWFATYGWGASRLGPDGRWRTYNSNDGLVHGTVFTIAEAPDGAIWFGTGGGTSRLGSDGKWKTYTEELAFPNVRAVTVSADGTVWFGTDSGLNRLGTDGQWETYKEEYLARPWALATEPNGTVWIGTVNGVSKLAPNGIWQTYTEKDGIADNDIQAIEIGPNGTVWVGTSGGLSRFRPDGQWQSFKTDDELAQNKISEIAVSPDGTLWFGTEGGVSQLRPDGHWKTFTTQDGLGSNWVTEIKVMTDGSVWFGTRGGGVSRLDPDGRWETFNKRDGLGSDIVLSIEMVPDGTLWFGTDGGGVSRLTHDGLWQTYTYPSYPEGLASNQVLDITVAPNEDIWFGTNGGGVSQLMPDGKWQNYISLGGVPAWKVPIIAVAPDKAIWFGAQASDFCDYCGVSRLGTDDQWQSFTIRDGLVSNSIRTIAFSEDGSIWFGTSAGLSQLGPNGSWITMTTQNGLADNAINTIVVAPDGSLLFGTQAGVSRYQPQFAGSTPVINLGVASIEEIISAADAYKKLKYGPISGSLVHQVVLRPGIINGFRTGHFPSQNMLLKNFIAEATFINPLESSTGDWDYGFIFRSYEGVQFLFALDSSGIWNLVSANSSKLADEQIVDSGTIVDLDVSPNGSNLIRLICWGSRGLLFVNNEYIAELDLSKHLQPGNVGIATVFDFNDRDREVTIDYQDFSIWILP